MEKNWQSMNKAEIKQRVETNRLEIGHIKERLNQIEDAMEEKKLLSELKELQIKQLWLLYHLKAW